ncbi:MAG: hypothetical protein LBJ00_06830 [Planctomycetaceae bacterium]|nr:hypothetical protein [Planctomycetaceae bacterium]
MAATPLISFIALDLQPKPTRTKNFSHQHNLISPCLVSGILNRSLSKSRQPPPTCPSKNGLRRFEITEIHNACNIITAYTKAYRLNGYGIFRSKAVLSVKINGGDGKGGTGTFCNVHA